MIQARVAAGVTAALLVVGAVVHFQPAQRLTAASFVSAALDVETLAACEASAGPASEAAPTTALAATIAAGATVWDGDGSAAAKRLMVQTKGPCVCKKNICTNGRVCDPAGALGQCYLPRCPTAAAGTAGAAIPVQYIAGCYCAADASFTSSNKALAYVGGEVTKVQAADGVVAETSKCGATAVCYAGETCAVAGSTCDAGAGPITKAPQTYAYAIPSISSNVFTDPKKFQICKSTAATTQKCKLPATPVTQSGETSPVVCEVVA